MLLPLFDLLNHNPATRIAWLADGARVSFVSEEWVGAGSEVFNNYGARPNEELLFSHGFALPGNQADATTLTPTLTLTLTLTLRAARGQSARERDRPDRDREGDH